MYKGQKFSVPFLSFALPARIGIMTIIGINKPKSILLHGFPVKIRFLQHRILPHNTFIIPFYPFPRQTFPI